MAKSLGYGKISIKLDGIDNITEYLKEFETHITEQILDWKDSVQLKEFLTMAIEQNNGGNSQLRYIDLEEFARAKSKDKSYLKCYSELENIQSRSITSLINDEDMKDLKKRNQEYLDKQEEYKKARKKRQEHDNEYKIIQQTDNIDLIHSFISKYNEYSEHIEEARELINKLQLDKIDEENGRIQKQADEKWEKIHHPSNKKYLQEALKRFIEDYPDSDQLPKAKEELNNLTNSSKTVTDAKKLDFSNADDIKSLERAMKIVSNPSESDKEKLIIAIQAIYPKLNSRKQGRFRRSRIIPKWLGKGELEKIISTL